MRRCAVFCRKLTPSDEDAGLQELEEAILHYYPSVESSQERLSFMGMCLGFVDFMSTFSETDKVDIIIPGLLLGQELSSGCLIEGGIKGQFLVPEGEYFLCSGTKDLAKVIVSL